MNKKNHLIILSIIFLLLPSPQSKSEESIENLELKLEFGDRKRNYKKEFINSFFKDSLNWSEDIKIKEKIIGNVYELFTMVNTFAIKNEGNFPINLTELEIAEKLMKTVYPKKTIPIYFEKNNFYSNWYIDYETYNRFNSKTKLKNLIVYKPKEIFTQNNKNKKIVASQYSIYLTDQNGKLITDKNSKLFDFSNSYN